MTDPSDDPRQPAIPDAVEPPGGLGDLVGEGVAGAGFDMGALLEQATQMQEQVAQAQEAQASTVVEGAAGGGMVKITSTGTGEFQSVTIDSEVVDPSDVDMLQDLVLAALHDVASQVAELQAQAMGGLGGLDLDLGGLGGALGPRG